jgi:hypothetical protein
MLGTFKHIGWRYSSRQLCNCVIGGVDVAHRIRVPARRSSDHLAVRLLIVLTSPHSYRSPVDRVTGLSAPAPAKRAGAQRLCALAQSGGLPWPSLSEHTGHWSSVARNGRAANDPQADMFCVTFLQCKHSLRLCILRQRFYLFSVAMSASKY